MMNSKDNEGRRLGTRIEVDFDFHLPSLRHGWWALWSRERARREERRRRKKERGKTERGRPRRRAGRKKARRRSKKRTMPLLHSRFEVENFLIENYESYLLCRGFGRRVVCLGRAAGEERRKDKGRRMKLSGPERRARRNRKKGRNAQGKSVISFCACGYDISNRLLPPRRPRYSRPRASAIPRGPLLPLVFSIPPLWRK